VAATSKYVAGTVQVHDARVAQKTVGATGAPFKAAIDLRMAYADVGTLQTPVVARLGRQELTFGDQRLLGSLNWTNAARTFDAARVTVRSKAAQVDLFAASVVRILDGEFDKSGNGNRLAGAYVSTAKLIPKGVVEPYAFYRRDVNLRAETGGLGNLKQLTSGARFAGALPARPRLQRRDGCPSRLAGGGRHPRVGWPLATATDVQPKVFAARYR
jgi:hypothetical protein